MSAGLGVEPAGQGSLAGMPQRLYSASPSRLLAYLECPRRYRMRYLDRPTPLARPPRAHTSIGVATHNALRDLWDLRQPSADAAAELVRRSWIAVGFRDDAQATVWRERTAASVSEYLRRQPPTGRPLGIERTVALRTASLAVTGRIDRLDERAGVGPKGEAGLVVVDYKTNRRPPTAEDARTSLPLALYAAAAVRMFRRRPPVRVELHHVPTGEVVAHDHTEPSLARKVAEAESIAADLRRADSDFAARGGSSGWFEPRPSPVCRWCDFRAHCPPGQAVGPEQSSWAALDDDSGNGGEGLLAGARVGRAGVDAAWAAVPGMGD